VSGADQRQTGDPRRADANEPQSVEGGDQPETGQEMSEIVARYERQLRMFEAVASTTPDFVYVFDLHGRFLYANRRLLEVWGMQLENVVGKTCRELGYEQWHHDMHMREIAEVIANKTPIKGEVPFKAPLTGVFGVYEYIFTPVLGPDGAVELIAGTTRDVTDRKRAEEALRDSEERYRGLVTATSDVIYRMNADWSEMRFLSGRDIIPDTLEPSRSWLNTYIHPDDQAAVTAAIQAALDSRRIFEFEHRVLRLDGSLGWTFSRAVPLLDADGQIVEWFGAATDITQRKRFEEQLRETAKLESVGLLAGGIAHDFNNLLTGILGNASLVADTLPHSDINRAPVEEVIRAAERASLLTGQLLAYAGKGRVETRRIHLSELVRDIGGLVETVTPKSARIHFDLAPDLPAVEVDSAQIQQVVMNLVINAAEAIGQEHGSVLVKTGLQQVDQQYLSTLRMAYEISPGSYVTLDVEDTGCGMDEATLARIFDPFFTTKFHGRGLGLSAVLGIVRSHKGALKVYSAPGRGTTFKLLLPAVGEPADTAAVTGPVPDLRGEGVILVVDDESTVRTIARTTLERYGYTVLLAQNGREALDVFAVHPEIRAVLLDLTMPVMDGEETLRRLHLLRPGLPVVLSSGFNEAESLGRFADDGLAGFLQKPYTATALATKIKTTLRK
jgi:PAS domain S-box-containing protein